MCICQLARSLNLYGVQRAAVVYVYKASDIRSSVACILDIRYANAHYTAVAMLTSLLKEQVKEDPGESVGMRTWRGGRRQGACRFP